MFTQLKNIDSAFKHIKLFSIALIVACIFICGYNTYTAYQLVNEIQSKIYILSQGVILEAHAGTRKENVKVEGAHHIAMFHEFFFSLEPDEKVILRNIASALYLADQSAKQQYDNLRENRYFSNIISGNVSQHITIDSVQVVTTSVPYYFRCYAQIEILRTTSRVYRSLITEGYLRDVSRSEHNPHGFLIERWNIIENRDLRTENR